jgi:hypothetical protein
MKKIRIFLAFALLFALLAVNAAAAVWPASITIKKAVAYPVIDGKLDPAEWGSPVWSYAYSDGIDLGDYSDQSTESWLFTNDPDEASVMNVVKNSKIDFYAMWDETYLYFGIYTESPVPVFAGAMEESDVANSWNARGIQFEYEDKEGTFTDIGFGTDGAGNTNQFWFMGANAGSVMAHDAKVIGSGNAVTYEIAMKWADLNLDAPAAGGTFKFTLSCNFHRVFDDDPFFGISLGGSEMTKNPDVFMPAAISADPAVLPPAPEPEPEPEPEPVPEPEPAPATEAPAPSPAPAAPPTGDTALMFGMLIILAACASTLSRRFVKSR